MDSLREPREVRAHPSFRWTLLSSLACWMPRVRSDDRIEERQEEQQAVLVEVEDAVPGLVPLAPDLVQPLQQRQQHAEVLQALDVLLVDLFLLLARHGA